MINNELANLQSDDLLLIAILFLLYSEQCEDKFLFIVILLILMQK